MSTDQYIEFKIDHFAGQLWLICDECKNRFSYEIFNKDKASRKLLLEVHEVEHKRTMERHNVS
jgi:hypothetical protein